MNNLNKGINQIKNAGYKIKKDENEIDIYTSNGLINLHINNIKNISILDTCVLFHLKNKAGHIGITTLKKGYESISISFY